jgi:hypothetical protein
VKQRPWRSASVVSRWYTGEEVRSVIAGRASKGEKSEENEEDGGENDTRSGERIHIVAQAARERHTRPTLPPTTFLSSDAC